MAAVLIGSLPIGMCAQSVAGPATSKNARGAESQPMTREQGEAILRELVAIHQLLEKQQSSDSIANELHLMRQVMERPPQPQPAAAAPTPAPQPAPQKVKLKLGDDGPMLGVKDAPVVLVEFSDYQCSYCRAFQTTTFAELKKSFIDSGKVRFVSRDLPLSFHGNALKAAQAARCAGEQNKFWEMRDLLIKNAAKLEPDAILSYAQELSLDLNRFKPCVAGDKYLAEIQKQASDANDLGISGTPSFVLGKMNGDTLEGVLLVGAQPYSFFEAQVRGLLEK